MAAMLGLGVAPGCVDAQARGTIGARAVSFWPPRTGSVTVTIRSPDSASAVLARWEGPDEDSGDVVLDVSGAIGWGHVKIGEGVGAELLWSPDSKQFFVTTSDEGLNGAYRLLVIGGRHGRIVAREVTPLIENAFGHPVQCGWAEVPNVVGITWVEQSRYVLVAAEIINHSNCDSYGTFTAYEVDQWAMQIVRRYDQLEAKQLFRTQLGTWLVEAPDECVRHPKGCYVGANHPVANAH
jgi:hypothetical protein